MSKLLVIEDEPVLRLRLRSQLEEAGHAVREAPNGAVGLALVEEEPPDVVVTDLYMPEKDGIEVLRAIKSARPTIKVIVMTGGTARDPMGANAITVAKHLGADRIFTKPFDTQTLLGTIKDLLRVEDRRRFPRFDANFSVDFFHEGTLWGNGLGRDLSMGGCAVDSPIPIEPMAKGDSVGLHLHLPGQHEPTIPVKVELAAVRWAVRHQYGLEFIKLSNEDHRRMQRYLETFQTASP